jgi:plastocyanin
MSRVRAVWHGEEEQVMSTFLLAFILALDTTKSGTVAISGQVELAGRGPVRDAVIYFSGEQKAEPLKKAVIDQRDKTFIPHVSVVTTGTKVDFPNNDRIFHNVFAAYDAKQFDLGMYARGKTLHQTFNKPGLVALLCNVHTEMSAYIMVVDTPYYAVTDKQGRFHINDIPVGTYTVHGWHESGSTLTQTLKVNVDTHALKLELKRK